MKRIDPFDVKLAGVLGERISFACPACRGLVVLDWTKGEACHELPECPRWMRLIELAFEELGPEYQMTERLALVDEATGREVAAARAKA